MFQNANIIPSGNFSFRVTRKSPWNQLAHLLAKHPSLACEDHFEETLDLFIWDRKTRLAQIRDIVGNIRHDFGTAITTYKLLLIFSILRDSRRRRPLRFGTYYASESLSIFSVNYCLRPGREPVKNKEPAITKNCRQLKLM